MTASALLSASLLCRRCHWRHCTALLSSRCASWSCRLCSPIILASPSCSLVAPADRCLLHYLCCHIMLHRPLILSSCRLVVACRVVASSYAALSSSRPAGWLLLVTSPLLPYRLGLLSLASGALLHCAAFSSSCRLWCPIPGFSMSIMSMGFLGGAGHGWLTVICLSPFTRVRMSTTSAQMMESWHRWSTSDCTVMTRHITTISHNLLTQGH